MRPASVQAWYSLIKYIPDLRRQDANTLGVVLFCPTPRLFRWKLIDPFYQRAPEKAYLNILEQLKSAAKWVKAYDQLVEFFRLFQGRIRISEPKEITTGNPRYELRVLFSAFVAAHPERMLPAVVSRVPEPTSNERFPDAHRTLTTEEAATVLDAVPVYLVNFAKHGKLAAILLPGHPRRYYFRRADVEAFQATGKQIPPSAQ